MLVSVLPLAIDLPSLVLFVTLRRFFLCPYFTPAHPRLPFASPAPSSNQTRCLPGVSLPASDLILKRARGIEGEVLSQTRTTGTEYKAKIRSFFVNLKDKNNPGLRAAVVSGELAVEKFAKMTSAVCYGHGSPTSTCLLTNLYAGHGLRGAQGPG
jgi:hypothetical protein